uniref:B3 domain-containing protein n=1 Tax=Triticum urartu TaxID=4572 RepID=A0A8R7R391_TRIUA
MRGSRTEPVDVSSDGSADSGSNENLDSSSDGSGYSSSYEGASMSSDGVVYISSDEGKHISSDEGEYNSLDEGAYTSSDEDMSSSYDVGVHRRMKEKKPWKACMNICDCPKEYTVGYNPITNAKCMYSKRFKISMCAWKHPKHYVESVEPAIGHYVCELNKTFAKLGQRMYFSALFTKQYLADFIATPVDGVKIHLSSGSCVRRVRLINGVDNRATIIWNWGHFAEKAKLTKGDMCVFSLRVRKGKPEFTVHKI